MADNTLRFPLSDEYHIHHKVGGWVSLICTRCEPITTEWDEENETTVLKINGFINVQQGSFQCASCDKQPDNSVRKKFAGFFLMNIPDADPIEQKVLREYL